MPELPHEFLTLQKQLQVHLKRGQYEQADAVSLQLLQLAEDHPAEAFEELDLTGQQPLTAPDGHQRAADIGQLKLLSMFYYAYAGLICLGLLFYLPVLFVLAHTGDNTFPFTTFYLVMLICKALSGIWSVKAAKALNNAKRPLIIWPMLIINCLDIPMGTILSITTLIVMRRPSIRLLFVESAATSNDSVVGGPRIKL